MWFSSFCSFLPKSDVTPAKPCESSNSNNFNIRQLRTFFYTHTLARHAVFKLWLLGVMSLCICAVAWCWSDKIRGFYFSLHRLQESPFFGYPPFIAPAWRFLNPMLFMAETIYGRIQKPGMLGRLVGGVRDSGEFLIFTWSIAWSITWSITWLEWLRGTV